MIFRFDDFWQFVNKIVRLKVKAMVSQLQESQRQMKDALTMCKSAIDANDVSYVSDYSLKLEPDFREAKSVFEVREVTLAEMIILEST